MPAGVPKIFRFTCAKCSKLSTAKCQHCGEMYRFSLPPGERMVQRHLKFEAKQWERIVARSKVTPGIRGPAEYVRLCCDEILAMPMQRLISSG